MQNKEEQKYLIAYLLTEPAADYHRRLSDELAERFKLRPVSPRIDPHLTLKPPFMAAKTTAIEDRLEEFAQNHQPAPFRLSGFDRFDDRVIFMDVLPSPELNQLLSDFDSALQEIAWLDFKSHEPDRHLHATLAYPQDPDQGREIMSYLADRRPEFNCSFDCLSLLKKPADRWFLERQFSLKG